MRDALAKGDQAAMACYGINVEDRYYDTRNGKLYVVRNNNGNIILESSGPIIQRLALANFIRDIKNFRKVG